MKLRMRGNSIRFRLTKSEVAQFDATGSVEETVEFGAEENNRFLYVLSSATEADAPHAIFANNRMTVFLPKRQADDWVRTNQVGIRAEQKIGSDKCLQIIIEKDFACLEERPGEDDADAFPHPLAGQAN